MSGEGIVKASLWGTAVFAVAAAAGVAGARAVTVAVSLVLFLAGTAVFLAALWRAIQRSRIEEIAVASLFFQQPPEIKRRLFWPWIVQIAVALAAAFARPYTAVAFAVLAPMYGLGLLGLWGARHGTFPPR